MSAAYRDEKKFHYAVGANQEDENFISVSWFLPTNFQYVNSDVVHVRIQLD